MLLDAFVLARDIREVDMRASPYNVSAFTGSDGNKLVPVAIETPAGKRECTTLQRGFAERGDSHRQSHSHPLRVAQAIGVGQAHPLRFWLAERR
ncbi:hypothetical protein ACFWHR_15075 [Leucobacter sp. NPDC058333]|uniref:hypothetical protein n=1 Tax=Leucobacter sp. NPDC058333 TaxID=3346450 RepID=UPI003649C80A